MIRKWYWYLIILIPLAIYFFVNIEIRLANWYFLLLIPIVMYLFLNIKNKSSLKFSSISLFKRSGIKRTIKHKIGRYFILVGIIFAIIALARPQIVKDLGFVKQDGIDIAMVLDVSGSMQAIDFEPNRLEVARRTMDEFISKRPNDRIALIVFAGTAYTKIPLTLDHNILRETLSEIDSKSVNQQGTAIGMAISSGLNRLKKSQSHSKIMILLTDGDNNVGSINPDVASELAKDLGIKIYTIGIGTDETIIPIQGFGGVTYQKIEGGLNEQLLREIADITNGLYFRAKDKNGLADIFSNIDELEKTKFEQNNFLEYTELAFILIKISVFLLLIGIFLEKFYFIRIP